MYFNSKIIVGEYTKGKYSVTQCVTQEKEQKSGMLGRIKKKKISGTGLPRDIVLSLFISVAKKNVNHYKDEISNSFISTDKGFCLHRGLV